MSETMSYSYILYLIYYMSYSFTPPKVAESCQAMDRSDSDSQHASLLATLDGSVYFQTSMQHAF